MGLEGRVAWITGSSSGNGRAIAERYAREGAAVLCSDIRADPDPRGFDEGPPTHDLITAAGCRAVYVDCNVADQQQVDDALAACIAEFGRLDAAFNNAGVMARITPVADSSRDEWDRVIGMHLRGVWSCMKYELRQMERQGNGAIVNNASVGALTGNPGDCVLHRLNARRHQSDTNSGARVRQAGHSRQYGESLPDRHADCSRCGQRRRAGVRRAALRTAVAAVTLPFGRGYAVSGEEDRDILELDRSFTVER